MLLQAALLSSCEAQPPKPQELPYTLNDLPRCTLTSKELVALDETVRLDPCILYDTLPGMTALTTYNDSLTTAQEEEFTNNENGNSTTTVTSSFWDDDSVNTIHNNTDNTTRSRRRLDMNTNTFENATTTSRTTVIVVVGVFESAADIYRDGALVAVQKLNADNNGQGAAIGYYKDHYVKIRLVVGVAGNSDFMGAEAYGQAHQTMLHVLLQGLQPQYILGTSSFNSDLEREIAGLYQTMLLAQVGPQSYYTSPQSNDYIFGAHIPSEGYGTPALQALRFYSKTTQQSPIRIVYRDRSEFFYSTCRAVYDKAVEHGFTNIKAIEYNPDDDQDGDGTVNHQDVDFLQGLANQTCMRSGEDRLKKDNRTGNATTLSSDDGSCNMAVWGCFLTDLEVNTFLEQLRRNGCRLSLLWLTVASWDWPNKFPQAVPYIQSGGQWHAAMDYGDDYFDNGQEMLDFLEEEFGYTPHYSALGAYHCIYLMYQNIRSFFKGKDYPAVVETFSDAADYEELRRAMLDLSLPHTLYGPTAFDEYRRNVGRGSAGMQWISPGKHSQQQQPQQIQIMDDTSIAPTSFLDEDLHQNNATDTTRSTTVSFQSRYELLLVSPIDQATSATVFPAPASRDCHEGTFVNLTSVATSPDILASKCDPCPINTFKDDKNHDTSCKACPKGSDTQGETGATICVALEDNLISDALKGFGYFVAAIVYALALGFAAWTIKNRTDPVVRIGQIEFLLLICVGPLLSSSTIFLLSVQAGTMDDDTAASRACTALPWLYSTGWMLQYGSLSSKSYRMYQTMKAAEAMEGGTVTAIDIYKILLLLLMLNWAIVIPWTILDPLVWERFDKAVSVDTEEGVLTYESYGRCSSNHLAVWVGPLIGLQVVVMIVTNCLLYRIRNVSDRYQESKYVGLASAYACEFLIVGIPILIAVGENAVEASYIILVCIVGLGDIGILLMIFVPKINFTREGLPEGVTVGQSIFKRTTPREVPRSRRSSESGRAISVEHESEAVTEIVSNVHIPVREAAISSGMNSSDSDEVKQVTSNLPKMDSSGIGSGHAIDVPTTTSTSSAFPRNAGAYSGANIGDAHGVLSTVSEHFRRKSSTNSGDSDGVLSTVSDHFKKKRTSLVDIVKEGVNAEPIELRGPDSREMMRDENGALVNCMTLQW